MKKARLLLGLLLFSSTLAFAQGARNIKINEVLTNNTGSLQDEFGNRNAWVELANTAYSS